MQSISIKALNYIAKNSKQQLYYWTTPTDFLTQKNTNCLLQRYSWIYCGKVLTVPSKTVIFTELLNTAIFNNIEKIKQKRFLFLQNKISPFLQETLHTNAYSRTSTAFSRWQHIVVSIIVTGGHWHWRSLCTARCTNIAVKIFLSLVKADVGCRQDRATLIYCCQVPGNVHTWWRMTTERDWYRNCSS